ncbi:MAG: cupin domain-containing protein [Micromonosporaceae bacterium]
MVRKYQQGDAELTAEYGIEIGRWAQYRDLGKLPFDAMWCVIPPGGTSNEDCHPEIEFAVVVDGHASYESGGKDIDAPTGSVILLESEERHVIHNRSEERPLTILSIYWLPENQQPEQQVSDGQPALAGSGAGRAATASEPGEERGE